MRRTCKGGVERGAGLSGAPRGRLSDPSAGPAPAGPRPLLAASGAAPSRRAAAHLLDALERAHRGDRVAVHEHVALRQQLDRLERRAVGPDEPVAPLDESLLGADEVANLDYVALHVVLEDANGLLVRHLRGARGGTGARQRCGLPRAWLCSAAAAAACATDRPREELDQVPRLDDDERVPRLARRAHRHRALDQVERARDVHLLERARHVRPGLADRLFAVLREEDGERGLLEEVAAAVVLLGERQRGPVVDRLLGLVRRPALRRRVLVASLPLAHRLEIGWTRSDSAEPVVGRPATQDLPPETREALRLGGVESCIFSS